MPKTKLTDEKLIEKYQAEFNRWRDKLVEYYPRFDTNYRQYTAYTETKGTKSRISDPVAPEQVEKVVQKLFEREPKFYAMARGKNLPREITEIMAGVAEYYWNAPERVQSTGSMRSKLKEIGREFCITGNVGTETYYNSDSETPDLRVIPIENITFDPTKKLKTSDVYYITQYVSLDYIESLEEVTEDGQVVSGIFKSEAIKKLRAKYDEKEHKATIKTDPQSELVHRSGSGVSDPTDEILLVTRYKGKNACRIADWEVKLQDYENNVLNDDPLDFAMDIELPKQPFAFSFLDFINGLVQAKDLILNQAVDYGAKALNPPLFYDPSIGPQQQRTLANAYKLGGLVAINPSQVGHLPMPAMPTVGFELLGYIQQRAEVVSGIGAYLSGVPNQTSDKTGGTKGGILALIEQAISPVKDRQMNIEESIIEPVINKWLKLAGALMGEDEEKYVLISGQSPKWVRVTRGLLTGKIMKADLLAAEILNPEEELEFDQMMLEQGKDPNTEIIFDVDWILRVETGSMAEADSEQDVQNFERAAAFGMQMGVQLDAKKLWIEHAVRAGLKEPEQYILEQQMPVPGQVPGMVPPQAPVEQVPMEDEFGLPIDPAEMQPAIV